jgi:glycosyl transferase family 1
MKEKGKVFILTGNIGPNETFFSWDMNSFYPGARVIPILNISRKSFARVIKLFKLLKKYLVRIGLAQYSNSVRYRMIAHRIIKINNISKNDKVVAYWANHILAISHHIQKQSGCTLDVCCHANDVFVDSFLGKISPANIDQYFFCCEKTMKWSRFAHNLPMEKLQLRLHPLPLLPQRTTTYHAGLRVINVARDIPKKNLKGVFDLVSKLSLDFKGISFTQIGGSFYRAEKLRKADINISFHPTLPWGEVVELVASSDLFIYGSLVSSNGDRDGTPNVLREAIGVGLPILAEEGWSNSELTTFGSKLIVSSFSLEYERIQSWIRCEFPDLDFCNIERSHDNAN